MDRGGRTTMNVKKVIKAMNRKHVFIFPILALGTAFVFAGGKTQRINGPAANARLLEAHVRMLAVDLSPRNYTNHENLEKTAAYIRKFFENSGARVEDQPYQAGDKGVYRNIIGSFGPQEGERLIIGAHYDACGPYPGADDNASGIAALLELARLWKNRPPSMRVDLVAYTLEEPPLYATEFMGSVIHAKSLKESKVPVRGMISLETIGYFTDQPKSQEYPSSLMKLFYPTRGNFIAVVGRFKDSKLFHPVKNALRDIPDLRVRSLRAPNWVKGVDYSDHRSYWAQGFPAIMITDTAFFRNQRYHTAEDTPDTLDYIQMAKVVDGVLKAVEDLAK